MKKEVLEYNSKMMDVLLKELKEQEKSKSTKELRKQMGEFQIKELNDRDSIINNPKVDIKRKYRIGYDYLFLPKKSFMYKGDLIGATSITILFKILDVEGNEILFETTGNELKEQTLKLKNGEECYLCDLFKCYFDKELFKESNNFDFVPTIHVIKSSYSVSFEIYSYTKDIDNGILEATEIDRNEFIDIMENHLDLFDTTDNKPAQSTSYVTEEIKKIDKEETKYYVYEMGQGVAGISSKEQKELEDNLICIKSTYEEAHSEMRNYIVQANNRKFRYK